MSTLAAENKRLWDKVDSWTPIRDDGIKDRRCSRSRWGECQNVYNGHFSSGVPMQRMFCKLRLMLRTGLALNWAMRVLARWLYSYFRGSHHDLVWADAKKSEVLKQKKMRITEDLTQRTKEAWNNLWPWWRKARKEGRRAGFQGSICYCWWKEDLRGRYLTSNGH